MNNAGQYASWWQSHQYLPYQREGIQYALHRKGTILADEMGLGKTIQAIGVINSEAGQRIFDPLRVVIVCPVSLKLNWWKELDNWLCPENPRPIVNVIGYRETKHVTSPFEILIIDEAQNAKNGTTQRGKECARLSRLATRRILLLTGTPFENRVREIWNLLLIANREYWVRPTNPIPTFRRELPSNVTLLPIRGLARARKERTPEEAAEYRFLHRYCGPKREEIYRKGKKGKQVVWSFDGVSNLSELRERLRDSCMIRRLKKDVLTQLPPKRREIIVFPTVHIEDDEIPLFVGRIFDKLTVDNYDSIVAQLHADKVGFAAWSRYRHKQGVEKIPHVVDHIKSVIECGRKVIVFAHHSDVIDELYAQCIFVGAVKLTGDMTPSERQESVERFQKDPRIQVFVGSIRAAGVGITLTASSHVIFAEIDPNPAWMLQAEDRPHRIGQRDMVLCQYLVADRTIDARLCQILTKKLDTMGEVLGVSEAGG